MTAPQLIAFLNTEYGMSQNWPTDLKVDAETYANCCQYIFNYLVGRDVSVRIGSIIFLHNFNVGPNNGLMFKNVELILKEK